MNVCKELNFLEETIGPFKENPKTNIFLAKMKKIVDEEDISSLSSKMEKANISDELLIIMKQYVKTDNELIGLFKKNNRPVFKGPKQGIFYVTEKFQKKYFKGDDQIDTDKLETLKLQHPDLFIKSKNDDKSIFIPKNTEIEKECEDESKHDSALSILIKAMEKSNNTYLGPYESKGSANGRPLFQGPKGGKFYISASGNRQIQRVYDLIEKDKKTKIGGNI